MERDVAAAIQGMAIRRLMENSMVLSATGDDGLTVMVTGPRNNASGLKFVL